MDEKDRHIKDLQNLLRDERARHDQTRQKRDALWQALVDARDAIDEALSSGKAI